MEKKETILDEGKCTEIIESIGKVSSELLRHSAFFTEILKNGSNSDSQADEIKERIKSTDLAQKILLICVMLLGHTSESMDAFFRSIVATFQFESDDEEMKMLSGLFSYFFVQLDDIEKLTERTNKDTSFAINIKPNGVKN